jgi:hypothetical protein
MIMENVTEPINEAALAYGRINHAGISTARGLQA